MAPCNLKGFYGFVHRFREILQIWLMTNALYLFFYFINWSMYLRTLFLRCSEKSNLKKYPLEFSFKYHRGEIEWSSLTKKLY